MKFIELFWLFMTILISLIFITNYNSLEIREKLLYLVALLLSTFLYSFRRYSRLSETRYFQDKDSEDSTLEND